MKKLILITLLLSVYFVPSAFAHSHLESSAPADGQVVTEVLREIALTFDGKVEQGSTFELMYSDGKVISIEDSTITDNKVIGTLPDGLGNGTYNVVWSIISADGHQIEGEFSFEVDIAETETPASTNNNEEEPVNEKMEDSDTNQEDVSEQGSKQKATETENDVAGDQIENKGSSTLVPILAVLLILAMIIIFILLRRKK